METSSKYGTSSIIIADFSESDDLQLKSEDLSCGRKLKKYGKKRLPILTWAPKYKKSFILADLIAGVTVWLTAVPQSMAYAAVVGLTPEYGLYSHFWGPILYIFLGSCRQVTIGPTAVLELLTFQTCGEDFPSCVILMGFYSGVVELIFGLLQLGVIISFISDPVTVGFTAGAACTIASAQVKNILGLAGKSSKSQFIYLWQHIIKEINTIKVGDTVLGVICIMVLLTLKKVKDIKPPGCCVNQDLWTKIWGKLALARNALVVFISSLVALTWSDPPFSLTGKVQSGFMPVATPSFALLDPHSNSTEPMSFTETLGFMGSAPLVVAFIGILQNVAISKTFGSGQTIDGTQEMIALGATNIIGGFFSCMPVSGSFTRSIVNDASGVKSQLGGLFVGILILLSLGLLTPTFQYIPKASLAAVVICAVLFMIEFESIFLIWKTSKIDFICCIVTCAASLLLGMEYGILVGIGVSTVIVLLKSLRPSVAQELHKDKSTQVRYILLKPDQGMYFPSVDFVRDTINKVALRYDNYPLLIIQCDKWTRWDFTAVNTIVNLAKSLKKAGKTLILYKHPPSWIQALKTFEEHQPVCLSNKKELHDYFKEISPNRQRKVSTEADHLLESSRPSVQPRLARLSSNTGSDNGEGEDNPGYVDLENDLAVVSALKNE